MSDEKIEKVRREFDKQVINSIYKRLKDDLRWDQIYFYVDHVSEFAQTITEQISYTLDELGLTINGLSESINIEEILDKKYPFNNSPEKNLERLANIQKRLDKEKRFWIKVQKERKGDNKEKTTLKKYNMVCYDCGLYPHFKFTKKKAEKIKRDHIRIMKKKIHETHKPRIIVVKENTK